MQRSWNDALPHVGVDPSVPQPSHMLHHHNEHDRAQTEPPHTDPPQHAEQVYHDTDVYLLVQQVTADSNDGSVALDTSCKPAVRRRIHVCRRGSIRDILQDVHIAVNQGQVELIQEAFSTLYRERHLRNYYKPHLEEMYVLAVTCLQKFNHIPALTELNALVSPYSLAYLDQLISELIHCAHVHWESTCHQVQEVLRLLIATPRTVCTTDTLVKIADDIHTIVMFRIRTDKIMYNENQLSFVDIVSYVRDPLLMISLVLSAIADAGSEEAAINESVEAVVMKLAKIYCFEGRYPCLRSVVGEPNDLTHEVRSTIIIHEYLEKLNRPPIIMNMDMDPDICIIVHRQNLLSTSMDALINISSAQWDNASTLAVGFIDESGHGVGVARDWYTSVCHELFHKSSFFSACPDDPGAVHPVALDCSPESLQWMRLAGILIGLGIKLRYPSGVRFSDATVRFLTQHACELTDISQLDPSLCRIGKLLKRASTQQELRDLNLEFLTTPMGDELFPGSNCVRLTLSNKDAYADMLAAHVLMQSAVACEEIRQGMFQVLWSSDRNPRLYACLSTLPPSVFNLVSCGIVSVSLEEWQQCTIMQTESGKINLHYADHVAESAHSDSEDQGEVREYNDLVHTVGCFFSMLAGMSTDERLRVLRFWTGLRSLPWNGFNGLERQFCIVLRSPDSPPMLPTARTCTFTLTLSRLPPDAVGGVLEMRRQFELAVLAIPMNED